MKRIINKSKHKATMGAARQGKKIWRLLPVFFSRITKKIGRELNHIRIPLLYRLIKYPNFSGLSLQNLQAKYFFDPQKQKDITAKWLQDINAADDVIFAADEICNHIFDLLGSGKKNLGHEINWHADFKSGHIYPSNIPIGPKQIQKFVGKADVKVPWELSRFQHFSILGKAYWLTNDEKYAKEFVSQITDWIQNNPWGYGVNWACPMDVAIRAANWILGYHFFMESQSLEPAFREKFLKSLWEHGCYIRWNLERGRVNGNHYLSDLAGLLAIGIFFSSEPLGIAWRDFALNELFNEMRVQVLNDGVNYEKSISYHRLVLELFTYSFILARKNNLEIPSDIKQRWERMFDFVAAYTKPDGTVPLIGDADDGMLYKFFTPRKALTNNHPEFRDHRYLLAIGALIFNRPDFARIAGDAVEEEAFWTLGHNAKQDIEALGKNSDKIMESKAFAEGGFYIMRSNMHYAIIDAGDNGLAGLGAHAHNDALSFELYAFDKTFIVDPGCFVYTQDPKWRNAFRSTSYHNAVMVDGKEISHLSERWLFALPDSGEVKVNRWIETDNELIFEGEHDAYKCLQEPVVHRRIIKFNKLNCQWHIEDSFLGEGEHLYEFRLHFGPNIDLNITDESNGCVETISNGANLKLKPNCTNAFETSIEDGWYAPSYGVKVPIKVLKYSWQAMTPCSFSLSLSAEE